MPRPTKYKKRDKKAEPSAKVRKPSPGWEDRKARIREAYGVKFPERTFVACDTAIVSKVERKFDPSSFSTPAPNTPKYSEPETEPIQ
jgi:hypothetical protein